MEKNKANVSHQVKHKSRYHGIRRDYAPVRVNAEDHKLLKELAEQQGVHIVDLISRLVKEEADRGKVQEQ